MSLTEKYDARILLVEDNTSNQQVALAILKKLGYRADIAANGKEALESLRSLPYDLVLMDCQMPEMDGYEAMARIRDPRSSVRNHESPVVAMTAHAMKTDREKCLAAGMNDYVSKPVKPSAVAQVLEKWLPARAGDGLPAPRADSEIETPAVAPPTVQVFDEADLVERMMGDKELAREIVDCFLLDMPKHVAALREHCKPGSVAIAARFAHSIRGAAANVSAQALSAVAGEMEMKGIAGDFDALLAQYPELEKQFHAAREAMKSMQVS